MEQLVQQIASLEVEEAEIEQRWNNAETDEEQRSITNELNLVRNRLSEKREELRIAQEKHEAIETKIHAEGIPFAVAGIDFTGLPAELITLIDQVVRADRRRLLNEHAIELEQLEHRHFLKDQERIREYNELEDFAKRIEENEAKIGEEIVRLTRELAETREQLVQKEMESLDYQSKLANASAQLDEKDAEIQRLESEVEDYQRAKLYGERESQQIIDITPEENNSISEALEAVKKLYAKVEDWGSVQKVIKPDGSFELATRDQVEQEWEMVVPDMPGGSESTESFRNEAESTGDQLCDQDPSQASGGVQQEVSQFQTVPDTTLPSVEAPAIRSGAAEENIGTVSLEERVAELEKAVFGTVRGSAA